MASYRAFAQALEGHVKAEEQALQSYERLLTVQDPIVSLIANLILEDERHHHALLQQTAQRMQDPAYWTTRAQEIGRQIPEEVALRAERGVAGLIQLEGDGARHLQALAKKYLKSADISAHAVTTWMALDSKKHQALLQLLDGYLREQAASAQEGRIAMESGAL